MNDRMSDSAPLYALLILALGTGIAGSIIYLAIHFILRG